MDNGDIEINGCWFRSDLDLLRFQSGIDELDATYYGVSHPSA